MITTEGLNWARDVLSADIIKGQVGTDSTAPSKSDTALLAPVSATLLNTTNTVSSNPATINVTHIITTPLGNGSDLCEWELQGSDGETICRTVTGVISKTSNMEITRISTIEITSD